MLRMTRPTLPEITNRDPIIKGIGDPILKGIAQKNKELISENKIIQEEISNIIAENLEISRDDLDWGHLTRQYDVEDYMKYGKMVRFSRGKYNITGIRNRIIYDKNKIYLENYDVFTDYLFKYYKTGVGIEQIILDHLDEYIINVNDKEHKRVRKRFGELKYSYYLRDIKCKTQITRINKIINKLISEGFPQLEFNKDLIFAKFNKHDWKQFNIALNKPYPEYNENDLYMLMGSKLRDTLDDKMDIKPLDFSEILDNRIELLWYINNNVDPVGKTNFEKFMNIIPIKVVINNTNTVTPLIHLMMDRIETLYIQGTEKETIDLLNEYHSRCVPPDHKSVVHPEVSTILEKMGDTTEYKILKGITTSFQSLVEIVETATPSLTYWILVQLFLRSNIEDLTRSQGLMNGFINIIDSLRDELDRSSLEIMINHREEYKFVSDMLVKDSNSMKMLLQGIITDKNRIENRINKLEQDKIEYEQILKDKSNKLRQLKSREGELIKAINKLLSEKSVLKDSIESLTAQQNKLVRLQRTEASKAYKIPETSNWIPRHKYYINKNNNKGETLTIYTDASYKVDRSDGEEKIFTSRVVFDEDENLISANMGKVLTTPDSDNTLKRTVVEAESLAVIEAIESIKGRDVANVIIKTDSLNLIQSLNMINKQGVYEVITELNDICSKCSCNIIMEWIPRVENKADTFLKTIQGD